MVKILQRAVIVLTALAAVLMAAALIKTVGFRDTDGPEISMNQDSITVSIQDTDQALLAGITTEDKKDGDVTDSLVVEGLSNFIEKGRRQVTVAAFDSDNNVAKATREVIYSDYVSPRFSLDQPLRFALNDDGDIASVFHVEDCLDGDLTGDVLITSDTYYDYSLPGEYSVTFQVSNSAGDVVELPATVEIYDSTEDGAAPKVELSQYLVYIEAGSQINPMDYVTGVMEGGAHWNMGESGNPYGTGDIEITNPVDTSAPGVYEIGYTIRTGEAYQPAIRLIVIVE